MSKVMRRILIVIPAVLFEVVWIGIFIQWLSPYAAFVSTILSIFAFVFVLYLITSRNESTYKTLWLMVILGMPIIGATLYLFFGNKRTAKPLKKKLRAVSLPALSDGEYAMSCLEKEDKRMAQTFRYVNDITGYPVCINESAEYYPLGEDMHKAMLEELEKAEKFIFAEYFIVENGIMWDSMVEIMARKAKDGVDIRVMYDDVGSISTYSMENVTKLRKKGIRCVPFNPVFFVRGTQNYRDHRKMLIIDGKVAFSGGVNLADEYINSYQKYGHWKDIGFKLTGDAVLSYTRMFSEFWNAFSGDPIDGLQRFAGNSEKSESEKRTGQGYVLSYYDSPLRDDAVSNELYIELLSQAKEYAWFFTPYLMLGDALLDAFVRAAKRGVDVRIIMPGIPDKKIVYRMSRSYYEVLLEAGVRIYEYTQGFVHAKSCLIDGVVGTVGTVNLDYRSLFLHFENNSLFYRCPILDDMKNDFLQTQSVCFERTLANMDLSVIKWFIDGILRIFAPLC